jgi:VanZ family protein
MNSKKLIKSWLPVVLWAALIFYLSSIPHLKASADPLWDKLLRILLHFVFYFILAFLWLRATRKEAKKKRQVLCLLFVFLYSLSDEIHQHFVPTRTFQASDILVDNLGSLVAIFSAGKLNLKQQDSLK